MSLIQSRFGDKGNLEAVVRVGGQLRHFWRDDDDPQRPWWVGVDFGSGVGSQPAFVQGSYGNVGNFELVVLEGGSLRHYWRANDSAGFAWQRGELFGNHASSAPALIQSSYGSVGNFEVLVREGNQLRHYWRANDAAGNPWQKGVLFGADVDSAPALIQSRYGNIGNFEVVVKEGRSLRHYWRANDEAGMPWHKGVLFGDHVDSAPTLIQSNFGQYGNFEVVVREGNKLRHYWRDNDDIAMPWHKGALFGDHAFGDPCLIQGNFGVRGNFELLAARGVTLSHFWRDNDAAHLPWHELPLVASWLAAHPTIAGGVTWQSTSGTQAYQAWPAAKKRDLFAAFHAAWQNEATALADPPPNKCVLADTDYPKTVLAESDAWRLFVAHVASSLATEIGHRVPWSLTAYSGAQLGLLLASSSMFNWDAADAGYVITDDHGAALPAPPKVTADLLRSAGLLGGTPLQTIGLVLGWCRQNLVHFLGGYEAKNMEDQWQYRGYPPMSRIIAGTPNNALPQDGIRHRTAGCHGTVGVLRALLRIANIPASQLHTAGHAQPHFPTEGRYLSHGDDPYNQLSSWKPLCAADELLIDQAKFDAWFGSSVPPATASKNVGRRPFELAIDRLPDDLLRRYCADIDAGRSHEAGQVFAVLKSHYTLAELDAAGLWSRMDAKLSQMGGCSQVPPP